LSRNVKVKFVSLAADLLFLVHSESFVSTLNKLLLCIEIKVGWVSG